MRKRGLTLLLIGSLIFSLTGCGAQGQEEETVPQQIELIEPVNAQTSYETAAKRNLYGATVYAATVIPYIEEYSAENGFLFGSYGAFLGETVKKGQVLLSSDTTNVDEQIKAKREEITKMEEEYLEYVEKQQKELQKQRDEEAHFKREMDRNSGEKPDEFLPPETEGGDPVPNPAYAQWKIGYDYNEGCYRIAKHAADIIDLQLSQRKELYDLDHQHQEYLLKTLTKNKAGATVTSKIAGTVVSAADFDPGAYVRADVPVVAVADMSQKYLKCEYVSNNMVKKAKEIFALIGGKRVAVEHQPMSTDEYTNASKNGGKVYSTFKILDEDVQIGIGDFGVIAVISDLREDVVSVSKAAIHKDELGNFVYVLNGTESVRTSVQLGYGDGVYTEIVSGLKEGDKVLSATTAQLGNQTAKVSRGEYSSSFSERAELTYSSSAWQKNTIKNGTVYFVEGHVQLFQHVDKGQLLATIRVEPDSLALTRNETRLTRLRERLEDYKEENKGKEEEEYYINTLTSYQEQMQDIEDAMAEQKKDYAAKEIRADKTGVIIRLEEFERESIIGRDANLWEIADESSCYMSVEDPNQTLQYGNTVTVNYTDEMQQNQTVEAMVGSMSRAGVSASLRSDDAMIILPSESVEDILKGVFVGEWWIPRRYRVDARIRVMKDVLLVPRGAVYDIGGKTYVYVKQENGEVKAQGFVSGGFNESYYLVVEGLSEGMEVCLK